MKYAGFQHRAVRVVSLPVRGAWIEISTQPDASPTMPSLPVRGAWIEMRYAAIEPFVPRSLPVRGAWIEISVDLVALRKELRVAPRAGSVD